jgi:anti-sigma B factor antagonist
MRTFFISDNLPVEETSDGDLAILAMGGELDYEASPQLRARLVGAIKAGGRRLVLDLSDVTFIDSTAIGVLAGTVARLDEAGGGSLAVVSTHEKVLQIFEITGLDSVISLHSSREEAVSAFSLAG